MKRKNKFILREIAKRGVPIVALLLLFVFILITWFLVRGFSQSQTVIAIGIAGVSAFFAAISLIAGLMQTTEAQRQRENQERPYITAFFEGTNLGRMMI